MRLTEINTENAVLLALEISVYTEIRFLIHVFKNPVFLIVQLKCDPNCHLGNNNAVVCDPLIEHC